METGRSGERLTFLRCSREGVMLDEAHASPCADQPTVIRHTPSAAVMAAVALVLVGLAVVLILSVGRHKGSYRTDEAKGGRSGQTADMALGGDRALPGAVEQGDEEYFI
ncbi:unnamed protein product [Boreogadus saida]